MVFRTALLLVLSASAIGGTGVNFKIERIALWENGQMKIITDQPSVNGVEGCTATDRSIALDAGSPATDRMMAIALAGKTSGADMYSWVNGCCVAHNGKQSPCISTLSIE